MKYTKNKNVNETMNRILAIDPSIEIEITRNPSIDGRLGCGAGYNGQIKNEKGKCYFKYNNSRAAKEETPDLKDILICVIGDYYSYKNTEEYPAFCREFGYSEDENDYGTKKNKTALAAYNGCKEAYNALSNMFDEETLDKIYELLNE